MTDASIFAEPIAQVGSLLITTVRRTYWLHYIGRGLYSADSFEEEAGREGVARAFPRSILARMRFGDPVLLAQFEGDPFRPKRRDRRGRERPVNNVGKAHVFGVFRISGLNMRASDDETRIAFHDRLDIIEIVTGTPPHTVRRNCGSYEVRATFIVRDDIPDLCRKAGEAEAEAGGRIRFFATGSFYPVAPHLTLDPARFNRAPIQVDLTGYNIDEPPETEGRTVAFIFDYEQRSYIPKAEAAA